MNDVVPKSKSTQNFPNSGKHLQMKSSPRMLRPDVSSRGLMKRDCLAKPSWSEAKGFSRVKYALSPVERDVLPSYK
jgi:hypothetical protein